MTGYQSKKAAALDEEGMYLVHHTQPTSLNGYIKKIEDLIQERDTWKAAAQRPWVGLTDAEKSELWEISRAALPRYATYASLVEKKLKDKNSWAKDANTLNKTVLIAEVMLSTCIWMTLTKVICVTFTTGKQKHSAHG